MDKIKEQQRITKIVYRNKDLLQIVKLLQQLPAKDVDSTLQEMKLPISKHLFITGNYSKLMEVKI